MQFCDPCIHSFVFNEHPRRPALRQQLDCYGSSTVCGSYNVSNCNLCAKDCISCPALCSSTGSLASAGHRWTQQHLALHQQRMLQCQHWRAHCDGHSHSCRSRVPCTCTCTCSTNTLLQPECCRSAIQQLNQHCVEAVPIITQDLEPIYGTFAAPHAMLRHMASQARPRFELAQLQSRLVTLQAMLADADEKLRDQLAILSDPVGMERANLEHIAVVMITPVSI
eukprot:SAG31_NODE_9690_length_1241_cov_1.291594_1_plen_224_part_00